MHFWDMDPNEKLPSEISGPLHGPRPGEVVEDFTGQGPAYVQLRRGKKLRPECRGAEAGKDEG